VLDTTVNTCVLGDGVDLMDTKTYPPTQEDYNRYKKLNDEARQRNSAARENIRESMLAALSRYRLSRGRVEAVGG